MNIGSNIIHMKKVNKILEEEYYKEYYQTKVTKETREEFGRITLME